MPGPAKTTVLSRDITLCLAARPSKALEDFGLPGPHTALFCNVHMLMLSQKDKVLAEAIQSADYVFADGVPVAWLQGRLHETSASVLRGYEAVLQLCERVSRVGQPVGFLGSTPEVLEALVAELNARFPLLEVAFQSSPPFVENELLSTEPELDSLNSAGLAHLFVGLGCPKQEKWIHRHARKLNCSVLGVGAAFEWLAGVEPLPPHWMEKSGLGWLHRLLHNPGRMWHRYLVYNPAFAVAAARALWDKQRRGRAGPEGKGT